MERLVVCSVDVMVTFGTCMVIYWYSCGDRHDCVGLDMAQMVKKEICFWSTVSVRENFDRILKV